ncbi:heme oxygenase-like domain-containing protein [Marinibacterium profundimaris]|uniref:Heme oxygenase n=1 Tax=Marinibacterium profundimaris TaxID=1679460 RepID=A0A225NRJ4_9RHOB|nr:hypothetical protein [Marinibacterium profundimaris]OWU75707.1 hypothetical protein ATO3_05740 [Marinibacterium profundimaris]
MPLDNPAAADASLRDRLRSDTAELHHALDAALGAFDLHAPEGLAGFLRANERGFAALGASTLLEPEDPAHDTAYEDATDAAFDGRALAADLAGRLRADLAGLGAATRPAAAPLSALCPVAVDYVVLGSRLGSTVLARHWRAATDPRVRGAAAYFSAPARVTEWQAFCKRTCDMRPDGADADRILDDTCRILRLFLDGALPRHPSQSSDF